MIPDAIVNFFINLLNPLFASFPTLPATTLPQLPPVIGDFAGGFVQMFGALIVVALMWRIIGYFLPGGAG